MASEEIKKLELFYNDIYKGFEINVEFINDLMFAKNELTANEILKILGEKIKQFSYFNYFAFYIVEDNVDFKLSNCSAQEFQNTIEQDVEKHIENGTFSWVLNNNKQIIINGPVSRKQQLLISIATKRRIHGMFIAVANEGSEISGIIQDIVSMLISTSAQSIDNNGLSIKLQNYNLELNELTVQLQNYNVDLEDKIKQRTQELEIAKDKAEQSAKSKLEFLANMSHEIRTPMNGVLGMLELLDKSNLEKTQQHYVDTAYQSGQNMMVILNDILELSKFEAGKITIEENEFNLIDTIEDVVAMFSAKTNEKKVELLSIIDNKVPEFVFGAQTRVWQIIMNLVGNAVKFTKSGSIVLTASVSNFEQDNFKLNICVKDTGIGISDEALNLIFNPFEQAEINTARNFGGTGLGLALCKRLVELLGGNIGVKSTLGEGSSFEFHLNLKSIKTKDAGETLQSGHILYIDSSENACLSIASIFERMNLNFNIVNDKSKVKECFVAGVEPIYSMIILNESLASDCYQTIADILTSITGDTNTQLVLLSSETPTGKNIYEHVITKPLRRSDITQILSLTDTEPQTNISKNSDNCSGSILLVEDNEVNQLVATGMLQQLGIKPVIANDGAEAVAAVAENDFDLILMDINMPNMDGYQATKIIRNNEAQGIRIPIIALTANVMTEDVKSYFDAGMDDFLAKPYSFKSIESSLVKWLYGGEHDEIIEDETSNQSASTTYIDSNVINNLKNIMGDNLSELIQKFIQRSTILVDEIMADKKNLEKIKFNIHSLKGSSGNIGANELCRLCELIENLVRSKQVDKIESFLIILKHELAGVYKELDSL